MNIEDFEKTSPLFKPEQFFTGQLRGWAILEGPLGGLQRRATLIADGMTVDGGAIVAFSETWTFDDGHVDTLNWRIRRLADGRYEGLEPTVEGKAEGDVSGCAFHWTYTRNVPGKDGDATKRNFDDWFFRIDERGTMVKGTAGRLGLPFLTLVVTYQKL